MSKITHDDRLQIVWQEPRDMPAEVRAVVEPLVREYAGLLPAWVLFLYVEFSDTVDNGAAQTRVFEEYRRGTLTIGAGFLQCDAGYRRKAIIHEFMHFATEPMANLTVDMRNLLVAKNPELEDYFKEQFRLCIERTTTDLTSIIERILLPHTDSPNG